MLLLNPALLTDHRIGIKKDLHVGIRENFCPNVTPFHHHSALDAQVALPRHHPLADFRMD